jgi:hypothetical protein
MARNIIMTGDQFAEKGTTAWADWQRSALKIAVKGVQFEARDIVATLKHMCESGTPAWGLMTREHGQGFSTFEEFVTSPEGLCYPDYAKFRTLALSDPHRLAEEEYDQLTQGKLQAHGGDRRGNGVQANNVSLKAHGNAAAYLRARLERDHPDIAAALARGEYPSARAAAIAAGIIKVSSALEQVKKLLPKLTAAERAELHALTRPQRQGKK